MFPVIHADGEFGLFAICVGVEVGGNNLVIDPAREADIEPEFACFVLLDFQRDIATPGIICFLT